MEEENSVFGADAKNTDKINTEENFNFFHKNKETAKKDIDDSAKELTDFIDSLSQDVPELSEEEINKGIEKILERTHPAETKKSVKSKKVTLKVLFLVALLVVLSFTGLYVVGSSHNISIENGFVSFAKETVQVVFFGEDKEEYISVDSLLANLEEHGYKDILFPQEFVTNSDEYKVSVPKYSDSDIKQVTFEVSDSKNLYIFVICEHNQTKEFFDYINMDNVKTITLEDTYIYAFEFNNETTIEFVHKGHYFYISSKTPYSNMVKIAESIQ